MHFRQSENNNFTLSKLYLPFLILILSSCNQLKLSDAREYLVNGEYNSAAESYQKLYRETSRDQQVIRGIISHEMAEANRKLNRTSRAQISYRNAIRFGYPDTLGYLYYAQMLHRNGEYSSALDAYNEYLALCPNSIAANNGIKGVRKSMKWNKKPTRYSINFVDFINSNGSDFSPMLTSNGNAIYFTSSRDDSTGEIKSSITGQKFNDIYITETNVAGEWLKPVKLESEINTEFDEGTPSFTSNGRYMFYTYSKYDEKQQTTPQIYYSRKINGIWTAGKHLIIVPGDTHSLFAHPAISPSGRYLYFVSDMPGGYGGKDLWRVQLSPALDVLEVENLGPQVNSHGNELFPTVRYESTIYFSSDGHPGMGGLDLFVAQHDIHTGNWTIKNMGPPLNSHADDFGITFKPNGEKGFFSSNRGDVRGYDNIYSFELQKIKIKIEGFAVDSDDEFIDNAVISVVGSDGSQQNFRTDRNGEYELLAEKNSNYIFLAKADGFLNQKRSLSTKFIENDTLIYVDFEMIPYDKPVVLENVFYDFDSWVIRPESADKLNDLVLLLNEHPEILMELRSHTDRKGTAEYNYELSDKRVQSVLDYLEKKGIKKGRLRANGFGKDIPQTINKRLSEKHSFLKVGDILNEEFINQLTPEQQIIADQINRRTEFIISLM